jgi:hypothetical protein
MTDDEYNGALAEGFTLGLKIAAGGSLEEHGAGFLIGTIKGFVTALDRPDRCVILIDSWASISIPNLWQGNRNPVEYSSLEKLGIDPATIQFEPMPNVKIPGHHPVAGISQLGWIEVEQLRPEYAGKWLLNLDQATKIHFPEGQPGVAFVHFHDGSEEALEDANHSRLLAAVDSAKSI